MSAKGAALSRKKEKLAKKRQRALDAYAMLQRTAELSASAADAVLAPFSISASQYGVLELLRLGGAQHQQELARGLGRSKAQMTAIINALTKRELATRSPHATDRRYTTIELTASGSALLDSVTPVREDAVVAALSALSSDQRNKLTRLTRRVVRALDPGALQDDDESDSTEPALADASTDPDAATRTVPRSAE